MNLLVCMKLSDRSLKYHIYPISLLDEVDRILIVRDQQGPEIKKVEYYCPPKWSLDMPVFAFFVRFLLMVYLSLKEKPALIHSYLLFPHGFLAFIVGKITRKRVAVSLIAGPLELYVLGKSPIEKYAYTKPLPKLSITGKIILNILQKFDAIVVAGTMTENYLLDKGIATDKIFRIPYVIVDSKCRPMHRNKVYDLIYVGRLAKVKHVEIVLKTAHKLVNDYNLYNLKIAIVGDGFCCKKMKNLCKKMELVSNVDFLGYKNDIAFYFNKSKMSIITSERETGPLTMIESMLCGVPVISSRCGDLIVDFLKDGYNGSIIDDYADVEAYASELNKILSNQKLLDNYSNNSMKISQNLNAENVSGAWHTLFSKVMQQG
ncbi:MAG: glycosyltransferase [Candidatus Methanoperedens sp.]|nr:glycosyltransferase [Candidatus Methanoperedens sp.]MCZ7395501.1 glycosyltransferase [Candidatus Methanoperedens sp.]